MSRGSSVPLKYPYFPPKQDPNQYGKDDYKNHPLLHYSLAKEKRKEVQKLVQMQADKNRAKVLERLEKRKQRGVKEKKSNTPKLTQEECLASLRKFVGMAPIAGIQKQTLVNITKLLPTHQKNKYPAALAALLEEVKAHYLENLREGTINMMIRNPELEALEAQAIKRKVKDKEAPWHKEFKKNTRRILINLHVLHPALRYCLSICKDHLNTTTLANCSGFRGDAIDLDSFCGNIISECEKTEETLMNTWFPQITSVFTDKKVVIQHKGERLSRFYKCASSLLSIQLRNLLTRSILGFVDVFGDRRKLPRIEMELILEGNKICFSPTMQEVSDMIVSVVYEMNKLLREVPTIESWISDGSSEFVPVSLHKDFIQSALEKLRASVNNWLLEPQEFCDAIVKRFDFLIDGTARKAIDKFIGTDPKFEDICTELQVYNRYVEQTQEITSLEYFAFIRLDCEKMRRGLGDAARQLANSLLQNVVDTYRKENESICAAFEEIERIALNAPKSTKEMIELGEYMLHVKNKRMLQLTEEIENSKKHLLYIIDVHIFSQDDIALNTKTLGWPVKIRPVFEQNTEIVEDCKARFEDNLQKKSEWTSRELEKLSSRVQELEELGEIANVQQYTYEVRMVQNKLKQIEDTICWINQEEALFKFPQSSYPDVGDMNTIQSGEGKMKSNIDPYARLFTTVLKWQKAEKKWTDGSFLELNAEQIEADINAFSKEMVELQKLFKSKFKQQALDGDSKYAKMNLEDSNPDNLPPPLRICALTIEQIKEFRTNIPIIVCLCNPGIRQRHWNQMSDVIGFDITPNSGSSLRKVLRLELNEFMPKLEAISIAATREHALELTLEDMKQEWGQVNFKTLPYRETDYKILDSVEAIQDHLDDHLLKTQIMRGSPYFKAFEIEVKQWESQLDRVQSILSLCQRVQEHWLYLEPIYTTEDIAAQMQSESRLFKEVDTSWKLIMDMVDGNPNVLHITESNGVLDMFKKSDVTVREILKGLDKYLNKKCLDFPRLFFLSRQEILKLISETRDPSSAVETLRLCFNGIYGLEFDELHEIQTMQSAKGEKIPFPSPIRTKDARGCVEKWLIQVEDGMKSAVRDIIDGAFEMVTSSSRAEWVQEWPCQSVLVAAFIDATAQSQEAIKGGTGALKDLETKYLKYNEELTQVIDESADTSTQEVLASLMIHDMYTRETINALIKDQVVSEKDFSWRSRPKCTVSEGDVFVEMLIVKEKYLYEYLGDCTQQVWDRSFEKSMYTFLTAFSAKQFPILKGPTAAGKHVLIQEVARILAQNLMIRNITPMTSPSRIIEYFKGSAYSGAWLCCSTIDRLREDQLASLVPWIQAISEILKKIRRKKSSGKTTLPNGETLVVTSKAFLCFTSSPLYQGRNELPSNMQEYLRPIALVNIDKTAVLQVLLKANGICAENIVSSLVQHSQISETVLSTLKKLDMRQLVSIITQMRRIKNEVEESDAAILRGLVEQTLNGTLPTRDFFMSEWLNKEVLGEKSYSIKEEKLSDFLEKNKDELDIIIHERLVEKTEKFLQSVSSMRATALCGPSFSGKSTIIKCALNYEQKVNRQTIESVRLHPKACNAVQLFGWFSKDGYSKWHDGILTKYLRHSVNKENHQKWIISDGSVDYNWAENLESFLNSGVLTIYSGEQLTISPTTKLIFETGNLSNVSPSFISKCGIVLTEMNELKWTVFLENWTRRTADDQQVMRWRRGQEELITGLFKWLLPPLISLVRFKCKSVLSPMPNSLATYMLEFFTSTLSEAIGNLKERKYLRSWIQAACVTSATWTIGGILADNDRTIFDSKLRDILMGRSTDDPLPPILNNKFDALPPAEGLVYDFVFDFKARGQWKHWNDVVKNMDNPEVLTPLTIIPTIDTARFYHVFGVSVRCKKPMLLIGPPGIGKSMAIWSKIKSNSDATCYKFTALPNSTTKDLKTWLVEKLCKKRKGAYGSQTKTGTIFIDDLTCPHPDEFGEVAIHEQIIELIDSATWYDIESGGMKCVLEDIDMVLSATLESGVKSVLSDRLLSRMNFNIMAHPSEDSFVKIFSTTLALTFKEQSYPPEVSGVIPSIIQSTYKVYTECRKVLLEVKEVHDRAHIPDLRDVQRIIRGCSALPKEAAENKKLFTRLWVHESLRNFFDRLKVQSDMDEVFQCMRHCVKTIFRENFDSAFEHLGKVDGQVTLFNLRNLLFGRYVQPDDESKPFVEVSGFDQVEKIIAAKVKEHNTQVGREDIQIIPIRYSLEMVSHIHRIVSTEGGHGVVGGYGGDGRRTMAKIASLLTNHTFFGLPSGHHYTKQDWRKDLRRLIKLAGSKDQDVVVMVPVSQMLKLEFLCADIDSLFARGEIPDLFSQEEKHQLNEVVHKHLMKEQGGKMSEMTPSELYEIFVEISRGKFHVLLTYNYDDDKAIRLLRMHKSILNAATILNLKRWPEDALRKSAELILEEVNADRAAKRTVIQIGMDIYEKAIILSGEDKESKIQISPSMYIQYLTSLSKTYVNLFSKVEDKRNRMEKVLQRLENISGQVDELQQELSDLQPRFEQITAEINSRKESATQINSTRSVGLSAYKQLESKMAVLKSSLDKLQGEYDEQMKEDNEKVEAVITQLMAFKAADVGLIKSLKAPPSCVKLAIAGMCIYAGIQPEKTADPQAKKNRKEKKTGETSDGTDYWVPAKKYVSEGVFPEKLCTMDLTEITNEKVDMINSIVLTHPEWDPIGAGKVFPISEFIAKWIVAVKDFHVKRMLALELFEELSKVKESYAIESEAAAEKWKALEQDEQSLERLKEDLEKLEHERSQINQDKIACKDKLEKGRKLLDELSIESQSWKHDLSTISDELEHLLGNVVVYAATVCVLPAFHAVRRNELKNYMINELKTNEIVYRTTEEEDLAPILIDQTSIEQWRLAGLPSDKFFTENAITIHSGSKWPLILDPEGRALNWLRSLYRDRNVKILQELGNTEEVMDLLEKSISSGDIIIFYDDACMYDSRLDVLYRKCLVKQEEENPSEEQFIELGEQKIEYSPQFRLFIISRETLELDLQTRCCVVNYNFTESSLNEFFLDTVFEREKPAKRQEYLLVCGREIEALASAKKYREKIQTFLSDTEGNVLDNANLTSSLLEMRKELGKSDDRVSGMRDMKRDMKTASMQYHSAAKHATILYLTIQKLFRIKSVYKYSFDWFTKVFRSSVENSNKSNNIDKRLRYLKDHLTYSLFCQVSYSLRQEDCLIFAFLLCCELMIADGKAPAKGLEMLIELWNVVTKDDLSAEKKASSELAGPVPQVLEWMPKQNWEFINRYAHEFAEMKGLTQDMVENNAKWKILYDAKEPDNLPLHEPWYTRLSRFHKLVVVAVIRIDKLLELVHSFVSDHIGYKFVETVQFDLGRVFSECEPCQPIIFTVDGINEAKADIRKFAKERERDMINFSMGIDEIGPVKEVIETNIDTGEKWILLENFENTKDIRGLLRSHITIDQDFHYNYRLWIVASAKTNFPTPELKACIKLTSEQAFTIRESIHEAFARGCIKEAKCWSGDRQAIGGAERHMSRLLYCLAFFHASLNERCRYKHIGGWSNFPTFSKDELSLGVSYLEMMSREFDSIHYEGLIDLLGDCAYANAFMDPHDRLLLETILKNCINEKAVTSNRYRFSVALTDFFVPNKTLYKDYIEFIKGLPGKSDFEVLDLDCSCQLLNDRRDATDFLFKLHFAISNSQPYSQMNVVSTLETLLDCVDKAIKAHDSFPFLVDGPYKWLWINEMTRNDMILSTAFSQLYRLNRCVKGLKVLDDESSNLATNLQNGKVPQSWLAEDKTLHSLKVSNFIRIVNGRVGLYMNINDAKILAFDLIVRPMRLLTAIRFNYLTKVEGVNLNDVRLQASFYRTEEDMHQARGEGEFGFQKLILLGATWDYENQMLVEKNNMHEYTTELPFALFTPRHDDDTEGLVRCPLYSNSERWSTKKTSSFLCYIPMKSNIAEELVFKKGIMLAVNDTDDKDN